MTNQGGDAAAWRVPAHTDAKPSNEARLPRRSGFLWRLLGGVTVAVLAHLTVRDQLWCELSGGPRDEGPPLRWQCVFLNDGVRRASWLAGTTVNALVRGAEIPLVFFPRRDAAHRAAIDIRSIFDANAGSADDMCHSRPPRVCSTRSAGARRGHIPGQRYARIKSRKKAARTARSGAIIAGTVASA